MNTITLTITIIAIVLTFIGYLLYIITKTNYDDHEETYDTIYSVYYMPLLSDRGKLIIQKHIHPNMSSEETAVYNIDEIMINIHDLISIEDLSILANIEKKGNKFIEF